MYYILEINRTPAVREWEGSDRMEEMARIVQVVYEAHLSAVPQRARRIELFQ